VLSGVGGGATLGGGAPSPFDGAGAGVPSGTGGAPGAAGADGAPPAAAPECTDAYPFADGFSCAEQAAWGKCGEPWMAGACDLTCGRCTPTAAGGGTSECGLVAADPDASERAQKLLCYLATTTYLSGQTDVADAEWVEQHTGRYPAVVAFDFYRYTDGDTSETEKAIDWSRETGGIVTFQWHWKSPGGGEYYTDYDFRGALDDPTSTLYRNIDLIAGELKELGDAGVVVLFRPLHEANNNFMWWQKHGPENYRRLWRLLFERTTAAGAHDVLWVFNGMAAGQTRALADFYPGDDVVDVISSDYYQSWDDYQTMANIGSAKNKVLAVAETFRALNPETEPPFAYSVVWASRDWGGQGAEQAWTTAMNHDSTLALEDLPDFASW
jgi:hypothetical protein